MSTEQRVLHHATAGITGSRAPPYLLAECHGLYVAWRPADPDAAYAGLPEGLERPYDPVVSMAFIAQSGRHTPRGGITSIAQAEVEVAGRDALDGQSRGRWWALYIAEDPSYLARATMLGIPGADRGHTEIIGDDRVLSAVTYRSGRPIVRTTVRLGGPTEAIGGQFRYLIPGEGHPSIFAPWAGEGRAVSVASIDFLERFDPSWALRPSTPLDIAWSIYSPRFCFAFSTPQDVE